MAAPQLAAVELAPAGQRGDQRRLAGAVGADQRDVLAALEPQLGVLQQRALADLEQPVLDLEDDAAGTLGRLEREAERLAVLRIGRQPVDLVELLRPRRRLAGARAGAEARHEALELGDLGLLLLDHPAERELALGLLGAPRVPRALEELGLAAFELEHRGADRLQEPAVVRHEDDRGVERLQVRLEPLEAVDVEVVGRLVEQQQLGVARERARQRRAGELTAGERREAAVQVLVAEPEAVQRRVDRLAPVVAAGVLELALRGAVGGEGRVVERAVGHRGLQRRQLLLERQQLLAARQHVVAQRQVAVARRALVVQRDPHALLEDELAAVDPGLAAEHAQQRRLARAVAPGQRHAVLALELERHAPEQGLSRHVLGEVGCEDDCHRQ